MLRCGIDEPRSSSPHEGSTIHEAAPHGTPFRTSVRAFMHADRSSFAPRLCLMVAAAQVGGHFRPPVQPLGVPRSSSSMLSSAASSTSRAHGLVRARQARSVRAATWQSSRRRTAHIPTRPCALAAQLVDEAHDQRLRGRVPREENRGLPLHFHVLSQSLVHGTQPSQLGQVITGRTVLRPGIDPMLRHPPRSVS